MGRLRPNPENLQNRFNILDMLIAVFIPALLASVWQVEKPEQRLAVFFPALGLSIASGWWTATLIHTFKIKGAWRRVGIHLYAFAAFSAFFFFVPAAIVTFFMALDPNISVLVPALLVTIGTGIPTGSILYLEHIRQKVEKSFIDEAAGAQPAHAVADAAQKSLKQLRDAKDMA